ncbi:MAG: hypothetical protein SFZ23_04265 [Planctomycetota bacterium]|nr:hypothetical protein [Planctomycetota bacterium]
MAISLTGCGGARNSRVAISGAQEAGDRASPLAIDVSNQVGSVTILSGPGVKDWSVRTRVRQGQKRPVEEAVSAELVTAPEGRTLRVLAAHPDGAATDGYAINLTIRVPAAAGVRVRTGQGNVSIRNVNGPIDVQVGEGADTPASGSQAASDAKLAGNIDVRTNQAITTPVLLATPRGDVRLSATEGSSGALDLTASQGSVEVRAPKGRMSNVRPGARQWRGEYNAATHPFRLFTGDGTVLVELGVPGTGAPRLGSR